MVTLNACCTELNAVHREVVVAVCCNSEVELSELLSYGKGEYMEVILFYSCRFVGGMAVVVLFVDFW